MPQLNPEFFLSQVFWLVLIFFAIYAAVTKYFLPRVASVVEFRSSAIERDITDSEKMLAEYKKNEEDAQKILEKARHDAFAIIDQASQIADERIKSGIEKIEIDINKKTAIEEEKLFRFKSQLQKSIEGNALDLQKQILSQFLAQLEIKNSKNN